MSSRCARTACTRWCSPSAGSASARVSCCKPASAPSTMATATMRLRVIIGPGPRRAAGVRQQHEGQESGDLAVAWQAFAELPGQADRLGRELDPLQAGPRAGRIAFVEDQIQHAEQRADALGALGLRGHLELRTTVFDRLFG